MIRCPELSAETSTPLSVCLSVICLLSFLSHSFFFKFIY